MNRTIAKAISRLIDVFYLPPLRKVMPRDTFRYAAAGGANMFLSMVVYFIAFHYIFAEENFDLGFMVISPHIAAFAIQFPVTFFTGFWLNKYVVFNHSPLRGRTQLMRYGLAVAGTLVLNYALMKLFVDVLHFYPTPSNALTYIINAIYSYIAQKNFSFRSPAQR